MLAWSCTLCLIKRFSYLKSLPLREVGLCVSEPLAAAEGLLCWEAPCLVASLLEKLHLLQGRRTHDLEKIEGRILDHKIRF